MSRHATHVLVSLLVLGCGGNDPGNSGDGDGDGDGDNGDIDSGTIDAAASADAASPARCSALPDPERDYEIEVRTDGRDRVANVHVPPGYDPTTETPIVLNFHGYGSSATQQATLSRMIAKSDAEGFIAVHASGIGAAPSWNGGACCGTAASQDADDVQLVSDLIDALEEQLCVDPARIFATGLSNGGFLSHRLACELSDRIAAVAPVAGVMGIATCTPSRPMPVMHFHGTADSIVPYNGNPFINYGAVTDLYDDWAARNNCSGEETTYDQGDASCVSATNCEAGGDVTLCTITGGGHSWPGGLSISETVSDDISATDAMWDFFVAHPHPAL